MQKSGHVEKGGSKNLRTTSKRFRYAVCGESGSRGWYTLRTMDKRFSGAGLGAFGGGYYDTPPKGAPEPRTIFLKVIVCDFGEDVDVSRAYG